MNDSLFNDIQKQMKTDFSGFPKHVYHGTRCPIDIIKERGLVFDTGFLISKINQCLEENNRDLDYWLQCKVKKDLSSSLSASVIMNKLSDDPEYTNRRKITVSTYIANAIVGASINPELLHDAVTSIYWYKNPSQNTRGCGKRARNYAIKFLERIGKEKVVVIDAKDPDINITNWYAFITTKCGYVPPKAILGIVEKPDLNELTNIYEESEEQQRRIFYGS